MEQILTNSNTNRKKSKAIPSTPPNLAPTNTNTNTNPPDKPKTKPDPTVSTSPDSLANTNTQTPPNISIQKYRSLKRQLKKLERGNFNSIIIIPCNGNQNWYELAEHSALFYYYHVVTKRNLKAKFIADTGSFYDQYQIGYMRTKGLDHIRNNLIKQKLLKSESHKNDVHIFKLNLTVKEAELGKLLERERKRRLENIIPTKAENLDPELHHLLTTAGARLHHLCSSRLDKLSTQTNGIAVVTLCDDLLESYHKLTQLNPTFTAKHEEILTDMRKSIYLLVIKIKIMREVGLWDFELVASISEPLDLIKKRIESNLKKIIQARAKHKEVQ